MEAGQILEAMELAAHSVRVAIKQDIDPAQILLLLMVALIVMDHPQIPESVIQALAVSYVLCISYFIYEYLFNAYNSQIVILFPT